LRCEGTAASFEASDTWWQNRAVKVRRAFSWKEGKIMNEGSPPIARSYSQRIPTDWIRDPKWKVFTSNRASDQREQAGSRPNNGFLTFVKLGKKFRTCSSIMPQQISWLDKLPSNGRSMQILVEESYRPLYVLLFGFLCMQLFDRRQPPPRPCIKSFSLFPCQCNL
jgi:hypothetical protein